MTDEQKEIIRLKNLILEREEHIKSHQRQIEDNKKAIADAIGALVRLGVAVSFKI